MGKEEIPVEVYCQTVLAEALHYTKSEAWTPNGIRRVFISPDAIIVEPFLGGFKGISKRNFSRKSFYDCSVSPKYKPMLSLLAGSGEGRVCSHIEEILVFPSSKDGSLSLNVKEADYRNLAVNATMSKDGLMRRYVRLKNVIVMNIDLPTFWAWYANKEGGYVYNNLDKFFGDSSWVQERAMSLDKFHGDDWYQHTSFRPQFYPVGDAEDGNLRKTLNSLKDTLDERRNKAKISKVKNEHLEGLKVSCAKNVKIVLPFAFCWATLSLLVTADKENTPQKRSVGVDIGKFTEFTGLREKVIMANKNFEAKVGCSLSSLIYSLGADDLPTIGSWYRLISGSTLEKGSSEADLSENLLSSAKDALLVQAKTLWLLLCQLFNTTYSTEDIHTYEVLTSYMVSGGGNLHEECKGVALKLGVDTGSESAENSAAITMTNMLIHYYFSEDFIKSAKLDKEYLKSYGRINK